MKLHEGDRLQNRLGIFKKPKWADEYFMLGGGHPHSIQFLENGLIKIVPWTRLCKPTPQ